MDDQRSANNLPGESVQRIPFIHAREPHANALRIGRQR